MPVQQALSSIFNNKFVQGGADLVNNAHLYHISPPPICFSFELQLCNIPQKNPFDMNILDLEKKKFLEVKNLKKRKIYCFELYHIGALCTKILNS